MDKLTQLLKQKTSLDIKYIKNIITLLEDGCTIPFIARYRKDITGGATDEQLLKFEELYQYSQKLLKRKDEIKALLKDKNELNEKVSKALDEATTLSLLEDIYEPFKGVKNTKADNALKNGLEPLANIIQSMRYSKDEIKQKVNHFIKGEIKTIEDAIDGAKDIIALRYAQDIKSKEIVRNNIKNHAILVTKPTKTFDKDGVYKELVNINQKASYLKSHKLLAIFRAANEKQINIKLEVDEEYLIDGIKKFKIPSWANDSKIYLEDAYIDGLKRLMLPSLKREFLTTLKEKASDEAIELFGKNLSELLITAPLVNQIILGIDPGYKTGCKLAILDKDGNYIASDVIYLLSNSDIQKSQKIVLDIIKKHHITAIAIGNGTASKETATFIGELLKENSLDINYAVVSEIGASVYSASKIAQEEYPNLDVTIRGAISIAQRLRDPLSALVKIDPKSLGIGQYQHDLNQKKLEKKLSDTTITIVNKVGVDINSSSYKLLSYVSGISEKIAKNLIEYKKTIGSYKTKNEIKKVKGLGAKTYEQAIGFFRIKDANSFLDNTGIHPESYDVAIYLKENYDLKNISNDDIQNISVKYSCGVETLKDIVKELLKPGYDIRDELEPIAFCQENKTIDQLKEGDEVSGVVRNITDFGAFVDIGLKNDALLHISQISNRRISHPSDILSINQHLKNIKILSIDTEKNRIGLTTRSEIF